MTHNTAHKHYKRWKQTRIQTIQENKQHQGANTKQTGSAPLLFSSSLSNHNLQTHTFKSKTQHSHSDTTHRNTPDTTDSSTAPGRHTTPPTTITRDGNRHGYKPPRETSNTKVQTQNSQGQPLYFIFSLQSQLANTHLQERDTTLTP